MKTQISFLFISAFILMGCDRIASKPALIQIRIPVFESSEKGNSNIHSMSNPIPTGFSGSTPINCFLMGISGPEESLRRNKCSRNDSTLEALPVGIWSGGVASGGSLSLEVPSGEDRKISIIGVYAPAGACKDFKVEGFGNQLSKPYLIGTQSNIKLEPGKTVTIELPVSFDENKWYDDCVGPDFPQESSPSPATPAIATKLALNKDSFPSNTFISNTCQSATVILEDDGGSPSALPTATSFKFSISNTLVPVYQSYTECQSMINSSAVTTVPAGQNQKTIIFRTPIPTGATDFGFFDISAAVFLQSSTKSFNLVGSGEKGLELRGTKALLPSLCYPFKVFRRNIDDAGSYITDTTNTSIILTPSGDINFYIDSNCSGTATTSLNIAPYYSMSNIWVKINGTNAQNTVALSATGYHNLTQTITRGSGTNIAWGLQVHGHSDGPARGLCYPEAYEAILVNQQGTAILANNDMSISLPSAESEYFANHPCSTPTTSITMTQGQYSVPFYLKALLPDFVNITATSASLQPGGKNVNVKSPIEDVYLVRVSQFNGVCAISNSNTFCWGQQSGGRLGANISASQSLPQLISPYLGYWVNVQMGYDFSCGVAVDSKVYCWGANTNGQLGDGTNSSSATPVLVGGGQTFKTISVANTYACGITFGDTVKCWGDNSAGQLGDGTSTNRNNPVEIDGGATYSSVSLGGTHSCGVTSSSILKCWGNNAHGKLGDGTTNNSLIPIVIDSGTSYSLAEAGTMNSCGITTAMALKCWGSADFGALGNGSSTGQSLLPILIDSGTPYTKLSVGEQNTCAITNMGEARCWGLNSNGRLGVGSMNIAITTPTSVITPAEIGFINWIYTASGTTCATSNLNKLYCWGEGSSGELGNGNLQDSNFAARVK